MIQKSDNSLRCHISGLHLGADGFSSALQVESSKGEKGGAFSEKVCNIQFSGLGWHLVLELSHEPWDLNQAEQLSILIRKSNGP